MRWRRDYYLFITGYQHRRRHRPGDTGHIAGIGIAYVAILIALYVDNGPHLPLWDRLPTLTLGAPFSDRSADHRPRVGPRPSTHDPVASRGHAPGGPVPTPPRSGTSAMIVPTWANFVPSWGYKRSKNRRDGRI
jgi:hypothetical protein